MKKTLLLAVTAVVALMAASCQKEELGRVLTATIEQYEHNGKAYINADNYACWENNDKVNINGVEYTVSISGGNEHNYSASIPGTESLEGDLLAFYPASQVSDLTASGGTVTLPPVQEYRENNGHQVIDNPMAAYCPDGSDELKFRNLCALLKVTIHTGDAALSLKAILVKGNENQMLWGTAPLMLDNQQKPMLGEMNNGDATVTLGFDSPAEISANSSKSFYIVVPDGSSFKNFTIYVVTNQNEIYKKKTPLGHTLPRNHIGAISYTLVEDDEVYAILYTGSVGNFNQNAFGEGVNVLSTDDGVIIFDNTITSIGNSAFFGCSSLTSIYLPAGVTSIGDHAFDGCSGLTSIYLPASVTTIGANAFQDCSVLTSIDLPATLTQIGNNAFKYCSALTSIDLSHTGVTSIGSSTFQSCTALTSISLPATLKSIGGSAFQDCTSLSSINLPTNLQSIGTSAFEGCDHLTNIALANTGVTSIGGDAFNSCTALTTISLPANLQSIGTSAFQGCTSLEKVYCYAPNPPTLGPNVFDNIYEYAFLYVPKSSVVSYTGNHDWSTPFHSLILPLP